MMFESCWLTAAASATRITIARSSPSMIALARKSDRLSPAPSATMPAKHQSVQFFEKYRPIRARSLLGRP